MKLLDFRRHVFTKYLLSHLIVCIVPVLILGASFYQTAVYNMQEDIEAANVRQLKQAKKVIEQQYQTLQNTATLIAHDPNLTSSRVNLGGYDSLLTRNELRQYKSNLIADEVYLYYKGDNILHSSAGISSITTLVNHIYNFEGGAQPFEQYINSATVPEILLMKTPAGNPQFESRMLAYSFPIPVHQPRPYGVVLFFINENKITQLIEDILGDYQGSVLVLDSHDQILASNIKGQSVNLQQLASLSNAGNAEDIFNIPLGSEHYSITTVKSGLIGWTFMSAMPTEQFLYAVFKNRLFIIVLLASLTMAGMLTALYFSFFHYRPIRMLSKKALMYWNAGDRPKKKDELHRLQDTFDDVYRRQNNLLVQIDRQRPLVQDQMLMRLLKGKFTEQSSEAPALQNIGLELPHPLFFVMIVSLTSLPLDKKEDILAQFAAHSIENMQIYGVDLLYENAVALLCNIPGSGEAPSMRQRLLAQDIFDQLCKRYHFSSVIGIGQVYDELRKVKYSFIEAQAAVDYKLNLGEGRLIFFEHIASMRHKTVWYPIKDQVRLTQGLKQGDLTVSLDALKDIMNSITSQEQSFHLLKCKCFDVINSVLRAIDIELNDYSELIKDLLIFNTIEELETKLHALVMDICEHINRRQVMNNQLIMNNILSYIHSRYTSNQFSLEEVAETFNLSLSNTSRLIKEITGETFTDYVFQLRIEKVKKDILVTNQSIKDVITSIGYSDVTSFNRKFKKLEGITLGQYRKHNSS
jgi:two-component system response regulator YesN